MDTTDDTPITQLEWQKLSEQSWTDLVDRGLPRQLADLGRDIGQRNERPIRVFTLPTMDVGIKGLAVPFMEDDGILFDPALLDYPAEMTREIARGLAYLLYPGWGDFGRDENDEMNGFVSVVTRVLVNWLPRGLDEIDLTVRLVLRKLRRT